MTLLLFYTCAPRARNRWGPEPEGRSALLGWAGLLLLLVLAQWPEEGIGQSRTRQRARAGEPETARGRRRGARVSGWVSDTDTDAEEALGSRRRGVLSATGDSWASPGEAVPVLSVPRPAMVCLRGPWRRSSGLSRLTWARRASWRCHASDSRQAGQQRRRSSEHAAAGLWGRGMDGEPVHAPDGIARPRTSHDALSISHLHPGCFF